MIERKIRYDTSIVEHTCMLLKKHQQTLILFHKIQKSFSMTAGRTELTIPEGSYTIAYYWTDKPYNLYIWRSNKGVYLGAYFNIVKNTYVTDKLVCFEDLIIDLLVLPDGRYYVLDKHELPEPLAQFEGGSVQKVLHVLMDDLDWFLPNLIEEAEKVFPHKVLCPFVI
ncbi:DUF402 domain-containing protein [Bacillaceae bacterium Marseille-Q3522]|nr:DUF402 domain-containing protein [Bacillaceae bacterium Marseille-Q3522]